MDNENLPHGSNESDKNQQNQTDIGNTHNQTNAKATLSSAQLHIPELSKKAKNASFHDVNETHEGAGYSSRQSNRHSKSSFSFKKLFKQVSSYIKKHRIATTLIFLALTIIIIVDVWYFVFRPNNTTISSNNSQVVTEYKDKLPELKTAIEKNPKDAVARRNYAVALYVISDLEAAKNQYEEAIKIDNKDATTYNNLGNTYRDLKNYDKAVEAYSKAIDLNPKYTNAYVNLANVQLYSQKKSDDAIATYKKALKAMPNDNQIELLLGIAYENAGKTTEAKQTYQNILSRSPDDKAAKSNLDRLNKK